MKANFSEDSDFPAWNFQNMVIKYRVSEARLHIFPKTDARRLWQPAKKTHLRFLIECIFSAKKISNHL
jgi:hypothetical protein